jgi:hypothetical protein
LAENGGRLLGKRDGMEVRLHPGGGKKRGFISGVGFLSTVNGYDESDGKLSEILQFSIF